MDLPFPDKRVLFFTDESFQYENIIRELYSDTCAAYGKIIKTIKGNSIFKIKRESVFGDLKNYKISTSIVEGYNNKIRQRISPFVRKTAAFSKSMQSHNDKMDLFVFANNFIEKKSEKKGLQKIKVRSPAMIEGIATELWTWMRFLNYNIIEIYEN